MSDSDAECIMQEAVTSHLAVSSKCGRRGSARGIHWSDLQSLGTSAHLQIPEVYSCST
jgi:hypothetical protein